MNSPLRNRRRANTPSPLVPASPTLTSVITRSRSKPSSVRGSPGEGHVRDEVTVGFEGPGRVVREVAGRARQAAKDHGRAHHGLFTDDAHERRSHPDQLLGAFATFELAIAAWQLDGDILGTDRGGLVGGVGLERRHERLRGRYRIRPGAVTDDTANEPPLR